MSISAPFDRRTFLKVVGAGSASLVLGCYSADAKTPPTEEAKGERLEPNAFVKIDPDGTVTVMISRSDMGQGIRTSFAMIVAEELDADWDLVKAENAEANPNKYGRQGTGGSGSTRGMFTTLQQAGAAARDMLVASAAQKWGVEPSSCRTEKGKVYHDGSNRSVGYGELTSTASQLPVPGGELKLKQKSEYKIIGQATNRVDNHDIVTGAKVFAQDVEIEGSGYAVVSRAPAFGARLTSYDDKAARAVAGVEDVVQVPTGVAVIAANTWAAIKGRDALVMNWDIGDAAGLDTAKLRSQLKAAVGEHKQMPAGAKVVSAEFEFPYLAHYTMEPCNAAADVKADSCEIWAPSQSPDSAQGMAARALGFSNDQVKVNLTLLGGGFGRKSNNDFVVDAVQVSKAAKRPVKMIYTREDDMQHDHYRHMTHQSIKGAVKDGAPVGWSHIAIKAGRGRGRGGSDFGNPAIPYAIPGAGLLKKDSDSPVPTGYWRSVDHSFINVVNEMFIDELAVAAGADPYEFRMGLIRNEKLKTVLRTCAEKAGWGRKVTVGHGLGIACFEGYGSYAAHVVEASVEDGEVKVHRITCVVDPGLAINPSGIQAQMEGSCCDAIAATLKAEITLENGGVVQGNPFDYDWARMDDNPEIDVTILEGGGSPGGMGETGYPSVPPAIANAVFAATGKRPRKFPIRMDEVE